MSIHTILVAHPSADLYGSDRMLLESVEGLVGTGAHVVVTMPGTGPLTAELEARGAQVRICPSPVLRKSHLTPSGLIGLIGQSATAAVKSLRLLAALQPDAVYVNTVTIPLWPVLARLTGRRVVIHVHESEAQSPRILRRALNLPLFAAHRILINSRYSSRTLVGSWKKLHGRDTLIYNGIPGPAIHTPPRDTVRDGIRLLYVGRLSHRKGVAVAIEALAELKQRGVSAQLDIVGAVYPGNEEFEMGLKQAVLDHGLERNVTFHGFQSPVWPFLATSDIVLIPSRFDEPFGNTAVEGILAARPVIVSNTSGLREAAGPYGCTRFVPPSDVHGLADAVQEVSEQWSRYSALAVTDAETAAVRHDPAVYRRRIARAVLRKPDEALPATLRSTRSAGS
ncbi:glycosyltransferase family 4 protein [Arthrobacter roseus]|uniref:glycosyltransferase family 4 protein n=1 Tax=Arthrobacter roseus TaxID=136274 RepID=UPI0019638CC0|nr:glycosyltransferase family 4 protein [Arthrobacter roseus]MBM7848042.1 glycosyltransferase involved in cell wall biosynthesis [Arthrobacter roseus]